MSFAYYIKHWSRLQRLETKLEWRSIPFFSKYEVSTDGRVRNFWDKKVRELQANNGYYVVDLSGDGEKKQYRVNRLIAQTFIPNPDNLPEVDHIDGDKLNNHVTNLRWFTGSQNSQAYNDNFKIKRAILQYNLNGKLIKRWSSMTELLRAKPKYRKGAIYWHIRENGKNTYGYRWECDPPIIRLEPDPKENFKSIGNYKGYDLANYGVSKNGNVINYEKNLLMAGNINDNGYKYVHLWHNNKEIRCSVHKLVATVYIPNNNPLHKTQVNHIDKNQSNNYYKNLEWITVQDNNIHAVGKMVRMIDADTNEVLKIFKCARDAGRYHGKKTATGISDVCNGRMFCKTAYGYKWEWIEEGEKLDMPIITIPLEKYNEK